MKRTYIKDIVAGKEYKVSGWVEKIRDTKYMTFVIIRDITGKVQVSIEKSALPVITETANRAIAGSVVSVVGKVITNPAVKISGIELLPSEYTIDSLSKPQPIQHDSSIDQRMAYRWLDLREEAKTLIFQVQTLMEKAMRDYLFDNGFIEIHSPKITGQSSEGGSEVFKLDYFGQPAYLTQSPQLYKQMAMAAGFEKVLEIGPYFRAESSFTSRHATEFMGLDIEISYIDSHHDVMDVEEGMLKHMLKEVHVKYGQQIKDTFGVDVIVPTAPFPRIPFHEALQMLADEYGTDPLESDFNPELEKLMCEYVQKKYKSEFVFITEYPFEVRAFYSMKDEKNPLLSKSFDLLWKDVEITSGAQREHRPEVLEKQLAEKGIKPEQMKSYIEFFEYGCPPHGGLGLGLARLAAKLLNIPTIKEVSYIFRGPTKLYP